MEKIEFNNPAPDRQEQLKSKFEYYLKDFSLSAEDLQKPLLDVGVNKGEFVQYLREVLGNTQAIGVENQGHKIAGKEGLIEADGLNLPFEDESFEIVTAHNYLPMFIDDHSKMQKAILELLRVTKKGGKMMGDIATPAGVKAINNELKTNFGEKYSEQDNVNYIKSYDGAKDLEVFLDNLKKDYKVDILNPNLTKTVVVIYK